MDYRIYHAINVFVAHHAWLGRVGSSFETAAVPVLAVATVGLWLLARPGASRKWKRVAISALGAAGLALLVNRLVAYGWDRARPFASHTAAHVWGSRSTDPSFPSDHASAAFAIAFAVLLSDWIAGVVFVAAAILIGVGRVVIGAHYPGDVLAGAAVGLFCALVVAWALRPVVAVLVRLVERVTDPLLAPVWRLASRPVARR
jgi:membrane-associated phospholipid phosphatase